jgi:hypothetical protein
VLVPHGQQLGPAEVYVSVGPPAGGRVSLVYRARPGLPAGQFTRVGALITEFKGGIDEVFVKKISAGGHVDFVQVRLEPGFWFSGAPHELQFLDEHGRPFPESVRLAGNTLAWQHGDITLRLECRCSEAKALAIASSVR